MSLFSSLLADLLRALRAKRAKQPEPSKPSAPCEHRFVLAVVGEAFARCAKCNAVTDVPVVWGGFDGSAIVGNIGAPAGVAVPRRGGGVVVTTGVVGGSSVTTEIAPREEPPNPDAPAEYVPPGRSTLAAQFPARFSYREMTFSEFASRKGIPNEPTSDVALRLLQTAKHMERVRSALRDCPVRVTSGYRSPQVNLGVGGSKHSAHCLGYAVDFQCPAFGSPLKIAHALSMLDLMDDVDQLIHEFGAWVHISFDPRKRGMLLTIDRIGKREGLLPCR